ncbi:MAG TPA: CDP-6-deoxy-delta-3,4-glucoseen reductase [Burkholderiales bacterium]|jgi:CDP-4-dehydro-6-deoxyglucose reductase|nr:CDP-6-deoxy-delta-3,4-glucoseen reductase [Burkholderiales bacterium]
MPYTITLAPSGRSFPCEADTNILKAGLDAGLFLPYSCRSGVCRTCRATIKEGEVDFGPVHPTYLSEADKAKGLALLCQARPLSDLVVEAREVDMNDVVRAKFMPARIFAMQQAAGDVMIITLSLPMNEPMLYRAGQYVEFILKDGRRRAYSIASLPSNEGVRQLELHIRKMPGGHFTEHVFGTMKLRDIARIEAPLGTFFLREDSQRPMVMLASGTGFAPIKAIIEHSLQKDMRRPITLYWGGRRREDLYMLQAAQAWADTHPHIRFVPVLSEATPECRWEGRTGLVHRAVMQDFPDLSGHQVYACGAPVMVNAARADFSAQCGLPEQEFYADSFLTEADKAA